MQKKTYRKYGAARAPRSPLFRDCLMAFLVGGLICVLAEGLRSLYLLIPGYTEETAGTLTSVTLVFVAVLLTALGVFDNIAKVAGAGTLVPITGFANGVCAPIIEFQTEGEVFGKGVKCFTIAGPVIMYGIFTSWVLGLIYWICKLAGWV